MRVELSDLYPGRPMHDEQKEQQSCVGTNKKKRTSQNNACMTGAEAPRAAGFFYSAGQTIWRRFLFV